MPGFGEMDRLTPKKETTIEFYERRMAELGEAIRLEGEKAYKAGWDAGYAAAQEEAEMAAN